MIGRACAAAAQESIIAARQAHATSASPRWQTLLLHERELWRAGRELVCGVDEVGLGPLAGPVVAAAVVLPKTICGELEYLDDSKRVTAKRRIVLAEQIQAMALGWAVAAIDEQEIDRTDIFRAARQAAMLAVGRLEKRLGRPVCHLLLDAHPLPALDVPQTAIIGGDGKSQSIAAASILAKVARDRYMQKMADHYQGYGFERHMGYPTQAHLAALQALGPSPMHRRSFGPIARLVAQQRP